MLIALALVWLNTYGIPCQKKQREFLTYENYLAFWKPHEGGGFETVKFLLVKGN